MTRNCCPSIADNLARVWERIAASGRDPGEISLMAVTKTVPPERVNEALAAGASLLGENRVQECCEKYQSYACGREKIHFIGHLQTNKICAIIEKVSMVESVDSLRLAAALDRACSRKGVQLEILLEVNIGSEAGKSGFPPEEAAGAYREISASFSQLRLRGLMAIPPRGEGDRYFGRMEELYRRLQAELPPETAPQVLSMGMSGDYEEAIRHGSTEIRLGRALFGERPAGKIWA